MAEARFSKGDHYGPRSKGGNKFGSVRPSVCLCSPAWTVWPLTLTSVFDLDPYIDWKDVESWHKTWLITVWPWPLTYDLDLQSQPSQGQGRPSCQKSRSKVKRFKQESTDRQTDKRTDGRTDGQTDGRTDATKRIISLASRSIIILIGS